MFHRNRVWRVVTLMTRGDLAEQLEQHDWCPCVGFQLEGMLWLNDSTGSGGAQEYAVIRLSDGRQVESITSSWCMQLQLREYIRAYLVDLEAMPTVDDWVLTPAALAHGEAPCRHCA